MSDEIARLVADVFELAGLLRRSGEVVAAREGHTQARWQLLSVVSDRALTVPQAARRLGVTRQVVAEVETAALQRQSLIAAQRFTHEPAQREVDGTSLGIESVHPLCGGHEFVVDLDVGP